MIEDPRWREWSRLCAELLAVSTAVAVPVSLIQTDHGVIVHIKGQSALSPFSGHDLPEDDPPTARAVTSDMLVNTTSGAYAYTEVRSFAAIKRWV